MKIEVNRLMQELLPSQPPPQAIPCATATAAVFCFQDDNRHGQDRAREEQPGAREIPLVHVLGGEGKMKPERIVLKLSLTGTGSEAPGKLRLPRRGINKLLSTAFHSPTAAQSWGKLLSLSRYRDETRENYITTHRSPGVRGFVDEPA